MERVVIHLHLQGFSINGFIGIGSRLNGRQKDYILGPVYTSTLALLGRTTNASIRLKNIYCNNPVIRRRSYPPSSARPRPSPRRPRPCALCCISAQLERPAATRRDMVEVELLERFLVLCGRGSA